MGADGGNHLVTPGRQPHDNTGSTEQQNPGRDGRLADDVAAAVHHADHRCQRTHGVGHIVGAVSKGHGAGGKDHHDPKHLLNTGVGKSPVRLGVLLDFGQRLAANKHNDQPEQQRQPDAFGVIKPQTDMLEALDQRHHGHHEPHQKHIERHVALGITKWMLGIEDQPLHTDENKKGKQPGHQRRDNPAGDYSTHLTPAHRLSRDTHSGKSDNSANNGVGG